MKTIPHFYNGCGKLRKNVAIVQVHATKKNQLVTKNSEILTNLSENGSFVRAAEEIIFDSTIYSGSGAVLRSDLLAKVGGWCDEATYSDDFVLSFKIISNSMNISYCRLPLYSDETLENLIDLKRQAKQYGKGDFQAVTGPFPKLILGKINSLKKLHFSLVISQGLHAATGVLVCLYSFVFIVKGGMYVMFTQIMAQTIPLFFSLISASFFRLEPFTIFSCLLETLNSLKMLGLIVQRVIGIMLETTQNITGLNYTSFDRAKRSSEGKSRGSTLDLALCGLELFAGITFLTGGYLTVPNIDHLTFFNIVFPFLRVIYGLIMCAVSIETLFTTEWMNKNIRIAFRNDTSTENNNESVKTPGISTVNGRQRQRERFLPSTVVPQRIFR
jgi:cellulose synthase/poly-beta-1,6-N-acetylglucosamine synthase-like glycosyltransferase